MNIKRWLSASLAVFVIWFAVEMIVHGMLLEGVYRQTASLWRPEAEMQGTMVFLWLGYLVFAPVFAFIYARGYEKDKGGIGQGVRYGVWIGILMAPLRSLATYATMPIPGMLAFYWFVDGVLVAVCAGIAVGLIYRE